MPLSTFCLSCGSENPVKNIKCSCCGDAFGDIKIEPVKSVSRATQVNILSVPIGEQIDFSAFESLAADIEKEAAELGNEKDLGKWGQKSITFKDILNEKK